MARTEADREDLFAEATALIRRCELIPSSPGRDSTSTAAPILIGTRRNEGFSIYLDPDDVWHFDAGNRLRRGFFQGRLFRSGDREQLIQLDRVRTTKASLLQQVDLGSERQTELLNRLQQRLSRIRDDVRGGNLQIGRHAPHDELPADILRHLMERVQRISSTPIQLAPPFK